jgi:putative hemolysin
MNTDVVVSIFVIFIFICLGGVFAAAEMALVSLRDSQVKQLTHRGSRGRTVARLNEDPNRFLSAVQIGVTLAGFLSAAVGGRTLSDPLQAVLQGWFPRLPDSVAANIALVVVTAIISYVSIVLGELTAKRLALQRSEAFALALAPLVDFIAQLARPVIWLLGVSTDAAVRVLGGDPRAGREEVTDEEIRALVSGSSTLGDEERRIVDDVFDAGSRGLREVMLPRTEVDFLPGDMPAYRAVREVLQAPHSRYPVMGDSADDIIGFIHVRDLLDPEVSNRSTPVSDLVRPVVSLPDTVRVLRALSDMRRASAHLAIVLDEYGGTAGIVTMEDLVEELVGDITDEYDVVVEHQPRQRDSVQVDGLSTLDEFAEETGYTLAEGPYDTVAGFFMAARGQLPTVDSTVEVAALQSGPDPNQSIRLQLKVIELDGRRAARLEVKQLPDEAPEQVPETAAGEGPTGPTSPPEDPKSG